MRLPTWMRPRLWLERIVRPSVNPRWVVNCDLIIAGHRPVPPLLNVATLEPRQANDKNSATP